MSKGLPLPLAVAMVFGTCFIAGGGGYFLARERFKSPAPADAARPPNPATPEVAKAMAVKSAQPVVAPTPAPAVAVKPPLPMRTPDPEPKVAPVPTLEEVITEANRLAKKQAEDEPAATAKRIEDEVEFMKRVNMINTVENFRRRGTLPIAACDGLLQLGLFELFDRCSLLSQGVRTNATVLKMISSHYEMSAKSGTLNLDKEAAWVLRAWSIVGLTIVDKFIIDACKEASRYFDSGQVGVLYDKQSIVLYKKLIEKR